MTQPEQPREAAGAPVGGSGLLERRFDFPTFAKQMAARPAATAIIYSGHPISYGELCRESDALAAWLSCRDVGKGDRVCIVTQNVPHFVAAMLAIWKCGAIVMPCNPMYTVSELAKLFADAEPSAVFVESGSRPQVEGVMRTLGLALPVVTIDPKDHRTSGTPLPLPPSGYGRIVRRYAGSDSPMIVTTAEDPAVLLYTSGTTGVPKGAILTWTNLLYNADVSRRHFSLNEESISLAIAPLFHITGLVCSALATLVAGGTLVLDYRFNADQMLATIRAHRPTFTIGAITAFSALMDNANVRGDDFTSFDLIYCGGAPMPIEVALAFERRFGRRLHPAYGMTETAAPTHITPAGQVAPVDPVSSTQSVGQPVDNTLAKIIDENGIELPRNTPGELLLRGPQIMAGYWKRPAETAEVLDGGWMHTGDIAIIDEQDWCYLIDRKKDMICASGFKIWPREVEEILYALPGVREAVVVGKPDPYRGETVKAYLALTAGASLESETVKAFVRTKLAAYKCPTEVEVLPDLPKTVSGKLQRVALREKAMNEIKEKPGA